MWNKLNKKIKGIEQKSSSFFKIKGSELIKINEIDYASLNSSLTFCHCEEDESPAWAIKSSKLFLREDNYASVHNSVLEIKGLPVFYFPYMRFPISSKRRPGLLQPSFSFTENNGFSYKQDFYVPINDYSDLTAGYHYFSERGVKLNFSPRISFSDFSFFDFSLETIRDKKWLKEKKRNEAFLDFYKGGISSLYRGGDKKPYQDSRRSLYSKKWWKKPKSLKECYSQGVDTASCLDSLLEEHLDSPNNRQRGKVSWSGQYLFFPFYVSCFQRFFNFRPSLLS